MIIQHAHARPALTHRAWFMPIGAKEAPEQPSELRQNQASRPTRCYAASRLAVKSAS